MYTYSAVRVGTAVSVSAICYPNGSAVYTWTSASRQSVRRVQIEYQCYTDTIRKVSNTTKLYCRVVELILCVLINIIVCESTLRNSISCRRNIYVHGETVVYSWHKI